MSDFASALASYAVATISMSFGNKLAVTALPLPCTLLLVQTIATIALLQLPSCRAQMDRLSVGTALRWLPIATLFAAMIFTSLRSFACCSINAIMVFRNLASILSTVVEYLVRGETVNAPIIAAEVLTVIGAAMYGNGALNASPECIMWVGLNMCAQVAYGVYMKHATTASPDLGRMSKYTMSMYNNVLATPMIAAVLVVQGEGPKVASTLAAVTVPGWGYVALTCFCGFLLSTSGFGLQKLVSATTFVVLNNVAKFVNILLGVVLLGERVRGTVPLAGCVLALAGGAWYSYAAAMLQERRKRAAAPATAAGPTTPAAGADSRKKK